MATAQFVSNTADGHIFGSDVTYAAAAGTPNNGGSFVGTVGVGQAGYTGPTSFVCYHGFLSFDTSSLAGAIVTAATLSLYGTSDFSTTDFIVEVRAKTWRPTVGLADWVAPGSLGALTLLATYDTSAGWATGAYNTFTSEAGFAAAINTSGYTEMELDSDRYRTAVTPSGEERVTFETANTFPFSYPHLDVTYSDPPPSTRTLATARSGMRW